MLHYKPQVFSAHEADGNEVAPLNRKAVNGKKAGCAPVSAIP
jgi:hypothetical protein